MLDNLCEFLQRPSVLITFLLLFTLIYLSAQNGAMQRELNEMHRKLEKFEAKENKLDREIHNMTNAIKDVKIIEDDLVSKEKNLEKKMEEKERDHDDWGADEVHMHPLMPHFGPPRDLQEKLHELGERIHNRVMNLRKEIFGHHDHDEDKKEEKKDDDHGPGIHVIKMHFPPFFPDFLKGED